MVLLSPRWARVTKRQSSRSWNHGRHRHHQKPSQVQGRNREETWPTLSPPAFQFPASVSHWQIVPKAHWPGDRVDDAVCRNLAPGAQSGAEKEREWNRERGCPGRITNPPAQVASIVTQFRPWREIIYKDRWFRRAWEWNTVQIHCEEGKLRHFKNSDPF